MVSLNKLLRRQLTTKIHRIRRLLWVGPDFWRDYNRYKSYNLSSKERFPLRWENLYPILHEKTSTTEFDAHYIYHPAWAAGILAQTRPDFHIDISSSLHFCTIVSAFIPIEFYDYRPVELNLSNLTSRAADLLALPFADRSVKSLSCMHVVEHIGLGRYGDAIDPEGDLKAMAELERVLAPAGSLLFVVPVGQSRLQFNAHRIYSYKQVLESFNGLRLKEFSLITDKGEMIYQANPELVTTQNYGCGCFWFERTTS